MKSAYKISMNKDLKTSVFFIELGTFSKDKFFDRLLK